MEKKVSRGVCACNPSTRQWPRKDQEFKASQPLFWATGDPTTIELRKDRIPCQKGKGQPTYPGVDQDSDPLPHPGSLLCLVFDSPSFRDTPGSSATP